MKAIALLVFLIFSFTEICSAWDRPLLDSLKQNERKPSVRGIVRLHSQGQFWFGGRIVTRHPTLDMLFTYDRKKWGFLLFKAADLVEQGTDINFMLAVVNKNIHLTPRLTITPSLGFLFEQQHSFADKGTDVVFIVQTSYKLSRKLTIDHSAFFGNLVLVSSDRDWINRLRLLYSQKHWDLTLWLWHNNRVFDHAEHVSGTLSAFYSRIKVTPGFHMSLGVSGTMMPYSSDPVNYPKRNGILFTVASFIR